MQSLWRQAFDEMLRSLGTTLLGVLFPMSIGAAILAATALAAARKQGRLTLISFGQSLQDGASGAFLAVVITLALWGLLYCVYFVRASIANTNALREERTKTDDLKRRTETAETHARKLLRYVPRMSDAERNTLSEKLKELGTHKAVINYVTTEFSGGTFLATPLETAFRMAGWSVETKGIGDHPYLDRVSMKINSQRPLSAVQSGVLQALRDVKIECSFLDDTRQFSDEPIELYLGSL